MDGTTILFLLLAVVAVVVVAFIFLRRRRASGSDLPMDLGRDYVDYTSLPADEEPKNLGERLAGISDRFANLPLPGKIAVFASPVLVIGLLVIGMLVLQSLPGLGSAPPPPPPPPPPPSLTIETARLVSVSSILVEAKTEHIPDGTMATAELLAGGEPFAWYNPIGATMPVSGTTIQFRLDKLPDAPTPSQEMTHTVRLRVTANGQELEQIAELEIPSVPQIRDGFFGSSASSSPEPTNTPTPTETPVPPEEITQEPEPVETAEPVETVETAEPVETAETTEPAPPPPDSGAAMMASVENGGNIRAIPSGEPILAQVYVNEKVFLLEKQEGGIWYRIRTEQGIEGWAHYSLLNAADLARLGPDVPVATEISPPADPIAEPTVEPTAEPTDAPSEPTGLTVSVGNGGNVRAVPGGEPVLDQINALESVELIKKLPDGSWYQIRNIRGVVGWVHSSLLNPDELANVSLQVPLEE